MTHYAMTMLWLAIVIATDFCTFVLLFNGDIRSHLCLSCVQTYMGKSSRRNKEYSVCVWWWWYNVRDAIKVGLIREWNGMEEVIMVMIVGLERALSLSLSSFVFYWDDSSSFGLLGMWCGRGGSIWAFSHTYIWEREGGREGGREKISWGVWVC